MKRLLNKNNNVSFLLLVVVLLALLSCNNEGNHTKTQDEHKGHIHETKKDQYVCSMFCDSLVFDKPGLCSVCGMELIKKQDSVSKVYTCPMHPQIIRNEPGKCPICGMDLVLKQTDNHIISGLDLGTIVEPVNESVIAQVKTTKPVLKSIQVDVAAKGYISYNPKNSAAIASRYNGRIDKLYVKYNFQEVVKGQKIMDVYSPELLTAQQDYVFLLNNNEEDDALIQATKQKLVLLGMNDVQLRKLSKTRKAKYLVSIYAPSDGHIHQMGNPNELTMTVMPLNQPASNGMNGSQTAFKIQEGMYIKKGETLFNIISLADMWVILKIYPEDASKIKVGQPVEIISEVAPDNPLTAKISFIEPMLEKDSKFVSVRAYLDKCDHHVFKIGSLVNAHINTGKQNGLWIPSSAILDLGNGNAVVFKLESDHFKTYKVSVGNRIDNEVNILTGLNEQDIIASDASYLVDSESFVSVKE